MRSTATIFVAGALCAFFVCEHALGAEDIYSANYYIEACRIVGSDRQPRDSEVFGTALCIGALEAFSWVAEGLRAENLRSCRPASATLSQMAKVVVAYLNENPARLHEPFAGLALEAFGRAWPCPPGR
jgi:hypothetical protein